MNFINYTELAHRFKNDNVPSKERFFYILVIHLFLCAVYSSVVINFLYNETLNDWDTLIDAMMLIITFFGIYLTYRANKQGDDKEYIERLVCLAFPITIRASILLILSYVLFYFVLTTFFAEYAYQASDTLQTQPVDVIFMIAFQLYIYLCLYRAVKIAASGNKNTYTPVFMTEQ